MASPAPWRALQQSMDAIVDGTWGEDVELHPWKTSSYTDGGAPDPDRDIVKTTGIYVTPGSRVIGEAATGAGGPVLENEVWLSIQETLLGDPSSWHEYDRVYFPDRDEWYEIRYVAPSATGRPNVHLSRLQDVDV